MISTARQRLLDQQPLLHPFQRHVEAGMLAVEIEQFIAAGPQ
jgi:hypothetical protein